MKLIHHIDPNKRGTEGQPRTACGVAPKQSELVTVSWAAATCEMCHMHCTLPHGAEQKLHA